MKLRDVELGLLMAFDALLQERSVTRAAVRLDISQSSMSAALVKLRDLTGDELLTRTGAGWTPTERALMLQPRVLDAIRAFEWVFEPPSFDPARASTVFRMIVADYIDLLMMPRLMRHLRAQAPGVQLDISLINPHRFGEMMSNGELDMALTNNPSPPEYLKARRLFSDRFLGVAASSHPVHSASLDPAAFSALPHITIAPFGAQIFNVQIDEALKRLGLCRQVRMVKNGFLALPFVLEASDMVACVPARLANRMARMADVRAFDIPLDLPLFDVRLVWHPRTDHSPPHLWLRELIVACAAQM